MLTYFIVCLGIVIGQIFIVTTQLKLSLYISIALFMLLFLLKRFKHLIPITDLYNSLFLIIIFTTSISYSNNRLLYREYRQLNEPINNIYVTAFISTPIKTIDDNNITELRITQGVFKNNNISVTYPKNYIIEPGYSYRIKLSLKPIQSIKNQYAFDYRQSMLSKNIIANSFIVEQPIKLSQNFSFASQLTALRIKIINNLSNKLSDIKYKGFFIALVTGYQGLIPKEQWEIFRSTGINHIISISGLHLTIATSTFIILINLILKFTPPSNIPRQIILAWSSVIFATCYGLIAGFSIPTQRALYMIIISAYLMTNRRYIPLLYKLIISLTVVLVIDPFAIYSIGFWFSYLLVSTIIIAANTEIPNQKKIFYWLRLQVIITLTGMPLSLYYFSSTSISSMIANLWAIPILGSIFTPAVFIATIINNSWIIYHLGNLLDYALVPIEILAKIPLYWQVKPNLANILISYIGIILLMLPIPTRGKNIFAFMLIINIIFVTRDPDIIYGHSTIHLFSSQKVGTSLIETKNKIILITDSNESEINVDSFNKSVMPYLSSRQIKQIDYLFTNIQNESTLINLLYANHIKTINTNLNQIDDVDGINIKSFKKNSGTAIIMKQNNSITYVGNCLRVESINIKEISNMIITLPNENCY